MGAEAQDDFREFITHRSSALLKTAVLLSGGDRHAGEVLLQNALVKAACRWYRIDEPEAYVRQIMYRQQANRWQLKWPRCGLPVGEPPEPGVSGRISTLAESESRVLVRKALARLSPRQRTVLVLRYFEDLPESEVARILDCSVGTVRSTTHRSLARLRALAPEFAVLSPSEVVQRPSRDCSPKEVRL